MKPTGCDTAFGNGQSHKVCHNEQCNELDQDTNVSRQRTNFYSASQRTMQGLVRELEGAGKSTQGPQLHLGEITKELKDLSASAAGQHPTPCWQIAGQLSGRLPAPAQVYDLRCLIRQHREWPENVNTPSDAEMDEGKCVQLQKRSRSPATL
eukprot:5167955-Amphidinium_carterae.1